MVTGGAGFIGSAVIRNIIHETSESVVNVDKIGRELGWEPSETFESGIRKTVVWYLNNLDWCKLAHEK